MMTKRGRTKGRDESEIQQEFTDEVTDVFAHLLLLAHFYHIDLEKSLEKWLQWDKEKKINQTEAI